MSLSMNENHKTIAKNNDELITFFQQNSFFEKINPTNLEKIMGLATQIEVPANEFIIQEGDNSNMFYLIQEGAVEVLKKYNNSEENYIITTLEKNSIIGEGRLLTDKSRSASIRTLTPTKLVAFSINDFNTAENLELLSDFKKVISEILIQRLDYAYNITVNNMHLENIKSKKIASYQLALIIILSFFLLQLGFITYNVFYTNNFCGMTSRGASSVSVPNVPFT